MPSAQELVLALRNELAPTSDKIRHHPYITALENGGITKDRLRLFAGEQFHIIRHDLRSFALLLSRQADPFVSRFLRGSVAYEAAALDALPGFAQALGMTQADLVAYEPLPEAHAYTAFLALTAVHHSAAEMAAAFVIDLEGWGGNCGAMSRILKERYGLSQSAVAFFDHFAAEDPEFEANSLQVVEIGLRAGVEPTEIGHTSRLMLEYELMYWDGVFKASTA